MNMNVPLSIYIPSASPQSSSLSASWHNRPGVAAVSIAVQHIKLILNFFESQELRANLSRKVKFDILIEARMSVRIASVFVLSCVGSGLATGLFLRPRSSTNCL
jgi:hypothetical protein